MATRQANSIPVVPEGMKVVLPSGRLLVIPEENDKTVAGIIVSGQKDTQVGTVIQAGPRLPWQEIYPIGCKIRFRTTNSLVFIEQGITFVSVHHEDIGVGIIITNNLITDEDESTYNRYQSGNSKAQANKVQCPDCWAVTGGCSGRCSR
jgi:hypothetical protein